MRQIPKPPSIKDVGLERYLDESADRHNGYKYIDLVKCLDQNINKSNLARLFGVSRPTLDRWLELYAVEDK